jgi:hypothetical protein
VRRLPSRRRARAVPPPSGPARLASPAAHRERAEAARAAGDLRAAARERFLSVLAALEGARLVGYGRHKTNREYVGDLSARGAPDALRRPFSDLVSRFDDAWYGLEAIDEAAFSALATACTKVEAQVAQAGAAAAGRRAGERAA